jgi:glycosyltransferase involved in cell wall biosynthesis
MHVLMTVAEMGSGGAESMAATLAEDLLAGGHEVTVASAGGWRTVAIRRDGARLIFLPLGSRRAHDLLRSVIRLRKEVAGGRVDIVHAHNVKAALVASAAVRTERARCPVYVTFHGVAQEHYRAAARILRRCADEVVAVSGYVADNLTAAGFPASRVRVIENAVPLPPRRDRAAARARLRIAEDVPVALCAARLARQKRHDLLVEAWRSVPAPATLLIAGDGPTRAAIADAVRHSGQCGRIHILGNRSDVDWLLAAADALVLPTDWEGLPVSVLEALAAGVPVVASGVGGLTELGGAVIELVTRDSASALAAGLRTVLTDTARRQAMATAGLALVDQRFSTSRMCNQYRDLFAQVPA